MVRSFADTPVDIDVLVDLLAEARRAPSAGNTAATEYVVLTGEHRSAYWDLTLPAERRRSFTYPRLADAGALVLVLTDPDAYLTRYSEDDKARTGRGEGEHAWPVPYWWVDAGAVIQNLLLLSVEAGLGACLFGAFDYEEAVKAALQIPESKRIAGCVAIGHRSSEPAAPGRSAERNRPPADQIIHWQRWTPTS